MMNCYRNAGSYGGERSKNMGHDSEGRMQAGMQKHRANHREPIVDVKPSGIDTSGQCDAVVKKLRLLYHHIRCEQHTPTQPFYGPFSGTTQVSRCQKRTSGLYGARED